MSDKTHFCNGCGKEIDFSDVYPGGLCEECYVDDDGGHGGCLTYFITGRVGRCPMLPVWRAIGLNFSGIVIGIAVLIILHAIAKNEGWMP